MVDDGALDLLRLHPDGSEELLRTVGEGDYFGEMGPLFSLPRSATARAKSGTTVTGYTVSDFRERFGLDFVAGLLGKEKLPPR
jgi:putative ABC transport system ATP-binding protein